MDQMSETEDYLLVEFIKVPFTHSAWNNHPLTNIIEIFYKQMKKSLLNLYSNSKAHLSVKYPDLYYNIQCCTMSDNHWAT